MSMALCLASPNNKLWVLKLWIDLSSEFHAEHDGIAYFSVRLILEEIFDDFGSAAIFINTQKITLRYRHDHCFASVALEH